MQRLLTDPLDLAAASPLRGQHAGAANTGTASGRRVAHHHADRPRQGGVTITFTGADPTRGGYDWELRDAWSNRWSRARAPGRRAQPIPSATRRTDINGFALDDHRRAGAGRYASASR
jgi:hypothetical protein